LFRTVPPALAFPRVKPNSLALPIAAGVFESWRLVLRPEIAAISMSGSSVLVAVTRSHSSGFGSEARAAGRSSGEMGEGGRTRPIGAETSECYLLLPNAVPLNGN
jgi:hypothetical protein